MFAVVFALLIPQAASANDTTQRLRTSVARMNAWLGVGKKAQTWRKILNLNVLDAQSAKGEQADLETLRGLLSGFDQGVASLQNPIFQEVRNAIAAQVDQLDRCLSQELFDLQFAAQQALANFESPSITKLEFVRDLARHELQFFKNAYRRDFDSRSRAEVFYQLKLNETIELLSDLKIELPPEVSVGKMRSMIEDERVLLEAVVDKIDALPMKLPKEDEVTDDDESAPIELSPPGPDVEDGEDLESLREKEEAIEKRIKELRKKYAAVFKEDRPRLLRRRDIGRALRRIQGRFRKLAKKQTDPAFASAKNAFDRFADAYEFSTEDNIQQEYLERVVDLVNLLPSLANPNEPLSHAKLGGVLRWLEDRHQLKDLCVAIRRKHSGPNAYVSISSRLIQSLASRSSVENDRIAEDFLGRFARGSSVTNTSVNVFPIDDPNQVRVSIVLNGTATANTYVRERNFKIRSTSSGYLSGRRDLFANLNGLYASESSVDASMSAQYGGISSSIGLIQRLAAKSFAEQQSSTDAESTRRARMRLLDRFDSETSSAIDEGVGQVETIAVQIRKYAALLPQLYLRSFSDRVEVVAKKDTRSAFGATIYPGFRTAGSDVQLKLHESMLSNYLDLIFSGRTFTKADLEAEFKSYTQDSDLFGSASDVDEKVEEVEDFKIWFPEVRPVQIRFVDNRMSLTITGSRFEQGENSIETSLSIELSFKVVNRNGKLFLQSHGAPEVSLSEGEEPGADSIAFAKILEKRLGEAVEANGRKGIELPANLLPPIEQLQGGDLIKSLQLGLFEMNEGWLYLGWNYHGGIMDTPAIWSDLLIDELQPIYLPEGRSDLIELPLTEDSVMVPLPILDSDANPQSVIIDGLFDDTGTDVGQ